MFDAAEWNATSMAAAADDALLVATDLADHLVLKGMPFREAHETTGKLVALAAARGVSLRDLTAADFRAASKLFGPDVPGLLDARRSLQARTAEGAPAPPRVAERLAWWRKHLSAAVKT